MLAPARKDVPLAVKGRTILRTLALVAIVFGIALRVHDIGHKTFFQDEAYSALRITGHTEANYLKLRNGSVTPYAKVAAFQRIDAGTTLAAALRSIATEEPQRGPLYYGIAELLVRTTGTSIVGFRLLGVACGVLAIGAAYLFGVAFFRTTEGGLILASLAALSPFHIAYARQAREYGLLSLTIFLSAAALVQALRSRRVRDWVGFAGAALLGMLTSPFFALIVASYVFYVACALYKARSREGSIGFVFATAAALALASPWYAYAFGAVQRVSDETAWGASMYPLKFYAEKILFNFGAMFFDYEFADVRYALVLVVLVPVVAYLAYLAWSVYPRAVALALALAVPTVVVVFFNDYRTGAHFGTIPRYLTAAWIAVEIVAATGIVAGLAALERAQRRLAAAMFAFILACGAFCGVGDTAYVMWWDNNENEPTQTVAYTVNAEPHPIVLIANFALGLSLEHYFDPHVRYELYAERDGTPPLDPSGAPNMLFFPNASIRTALVAGKPPKAGLSAVFSKTGSAVGGFHRALESERMNIASGTLLDSSPENALWIVERR